MAIISAFPLLVIICSGVLLSISPKVEFFQPTAPRQVSGIALSFEQILAIAKKVPEAEIRSWEDVVQVDARPFLGVVRVRSENYWEIQMNAQTGEILKVAPRWKTLLVLIHEGSWFTSWAKLWVFFPAGLMALILWFTGMILWAQRYKFFRKIFSR